MRRDVHPHYGPIVFRDKSAETAFLTRSTLRPAETVTWTDGKVYPVCDVGVSSSSHPFWTGRGRVVDSVGRVAAFERRYGAST